MTGVVVVLVVAVVAVVAYVIRNAEPILRRRVIATMEDRFRSPVELDALHISVMQGLQVSGSGLRILSLDGTDGMVSRPANAAPMVSVASFQFRTGVRQLLEPTMRVQTVLVQGLRLNIPPKNARGPLLPPQKRRRGRPALNIVVDQIVCSDAVLTIETDKPGKQPLVFPIRDLTLHDVGRRKPIRFEASLLNPKPVGDIRSTGHFGPWNDEEPRDTPIDGAYSFTNADLGTIRGIAGTLSSTGRYSGTLGEIGVDGSTETPDFALDVSEHPVDLHTDFNATVDGTTGDTILNSVRATLLHTVLEVTGKVIRTSGGQDNGDRSGHFIDIAVTTEKARVEDILTLGAETTPPLMHGGLSLRARLNIPPGHESVSHKMRINGTFAIRGATFTNPKWQETVDNLSMRAQGHPRDKNDVTASPVVESEMGGNFALAQAVLGIPRLTYQMPGAKVALAGKYSLDGQVFDFAGTVQTEATASQMLTGWKKWLAVPFDPLFKKDGAGLEVPITISGTKSEPKFGVDKDKLWNQIFHRQDKQDQPHQPGAHRPE
jgi:hypothetical protein